MSIKSWKEEFYPVPAQKVSKKDAIKHSLTKWLGLTKENLEKHGLRSHWGGLLAIDPGAHKIFFTIDDNTCALCHHYMEYQNDEPCINCPLVKNHFVTSEGCGQGDTDDIYSQFRSEKNNPLPMIKALKYCLMKKH